MTRTSPRRGSVTPLILGLLGLLGTVVLGPPGAGQVTHADTAVAAATTVRSAGGTTLAARSATKAKAKKWERKIRKLTNTRRAKHGCAPLKNAKALRKAARKHSRLMARHRTMSHQLAGEPAMARRAEAAGYRGWRRLGENVAYGYGTPAAMVRGWMHSPGHRANILNCGFRDLGVGVSFAGGAPWATQDFGRR